MSIYTLRNWAFPTHVAFRLASHFAMCGQDEMSAEFEKLISKPKAKSGICKHLSRLMLTESGIEGVESPYPTMRL